MYQRLSKWAEFNNFAKLCEVSDVNIKKAVASNVLHLHNPVVGNCEILDFDNTWGQLQYLCTFYIKALNAVLNIGSKAFATKQPDGTPFIGVKMMNYIKYIKCITTQTGNN